MGCFCFWGETQIWLADLRSSVFCLFSCFVIVVATFCEFVIWTLTLFVKSEFTFILLSGPSLWPASAALRKKIPLHLSQWGSPASRAETWQQISRFVQIKKKPASMPSLENSKAGNKSPRQCNCWKQKGYYIKTEWSQPCRRVDFLFGFLKRTFTGSVWDLFIP